ncbi:MAG: NUDIX domain-containing protein [Bacteroidia bacterium]
MMIRAAGILFVDPQGRILLVRRTAEGDRPREWALLGGKIEGDESALEAATREVGEEGGAPAAAAIAAPVEWVRTVSGDVDYTTFKQDVPAEFVPVLNPEHDAFAWATVAGTEAKADDGTPFPLHTGMAVALARFGWDELDCARAMAAGTIASPLRYRNVTLFALRITGTGMSFRSDGEEYVWRDPAIFLADHFVARCAGLPVILDHPASETLNSKEFSHRIVGTISLPYVRDSEVWGIAKIFDDAAIAMMTTEQLSTSPCVVFSSRSGNEVRELPDGASLLIEGKPVLLDHLAICEQGVWDKGGPPAGVDATLNGDAPVPDPNAVPPVPPGNTPAPPAAAPDAVPGVEPVAPEGPEDKLKAFMDACMAKMDAMGARIDAMAPAPAAVDDGAPPPPPPGPAQPDPGINAMDSDLPAEIAEMPKETVADSVRRDHAIAGFRHRQGLLKAAADKVRADAAAEKDALLKRIAALEGRTVSSTEPTPEQRAELATEQARADAIYTMHGKRAAAPLLGEDVAAYRRRMLTGLQGHSPAWKDIALAELNGKALGVAADSIYADAAKASRDPALVPQGQLREVHRNDAANRKIAEFVGDSGVWMEPFVMKPQHIDYFGKKRS